MICRLLLFVAASCGLVLSQTGLARRLSVHTQVREDIFAGYITGDMERFEVGVKKLDQLLQENPDNLPALGWRASTELFRAVRAHEAGKTAEFRKMYDQSIATMDRALSSTPKDPGVIATTGATLILFGDRLPAEKQAESYKKGRALFKELASLQKPVLDRLPLHMRGELLAGLAQSAERLGDWEDAQLYLNQIVKDLPDTPYERKARKWLDQPAAAKGSAMVCQTCHDAGRLENMVRAQNKN